MVEHTIEQDGFFFVSFGVEEGGLLKFLDLPATADNVTVKKAVSDYRKELNIDFKTKRKELRDKLKEEEITQEEFDAQVSEWEQEKDDKLAELNAMSEGYELKIAQQRELANRGIEDDTIIWFEMFKPVDDHPSLLWQLLTRKRPLIRSDVSRAIEIANAPLYDLSRLPIETLLDQLFVSYNETYLIDVLFDAHGLLDQALTAQLTTPISMKQLLGEIIQQTRDNIDKTYQAERRELEEQVRAEAISEQDAIAQQKTWEQVIENRLTQMTKLLEDSTMDQFYIDTHARIPQRYDTLRTFLTTYPETLVFLAELARAYRDTVSQRLANFDFEPQKASNPKPLLEIMDGIQQQHLTEVLLTDMLWQDVKHTNRNTWLQRIDEWVGEISTFDDLWQPMQQKLDSLSDTLNYRYSQYLDELATDALDEIPDAPIRFEDMTESERAQWNHSNEPSGSLNQDRMKRWLDMLGRAKAGGSVSGKDADKLDDVYRKLMGEES